MSLLTNLDVLPGDVQKKFGPFALKLLELHKDNLTSIVIYGSATGINYHPKISNINSAVIFRQISFSTLKDTLPLIREGIKQRIIAPLFLTLTHIETSKDVFPIEFLEIKENHIELYGDSIWKELDIPQEYIRLFCEQQIKGKLIRLRQGYLEVGGNSKQLEQLFKDSINSLVLIMRNFLRLRNIDMTVNKEKTIAEFCKTFGINEDTLLSVYHQSTQKSKVHSSHYDELFAAYLAELEKIVTITDQL